MHFSKVSKYFSMFGSCPLKTIPRLSVSQPKIQKFCFPLFHKKSCKHNAKNAQVKIPNSHTTWQTTSTGMEKWLKKYLLSMKMLHLKNLI